MCIYHDKHSPQRRVMDVDESSRRVWCVVVSDSDAQALALLEKIPLDKRKTGALGIFLSLINCYNLARREKVHGDSPQHPAFNERLNSSSCLISLTTPQCTGTVRTVRIPE